MSNKIAVQSIRIYGSESDYAGDHLFSSWYDAGQHIRGIASFAPKGGACDKTKFSVKFQDDSDYSGRLDIQHYTMPYPANDNDLARHILDHCRFYTGDFCPSHMTREDYLGFLNGYGEMAEEYRDFLTTYDIPETDGVINIDKLVLCLGCQEPHTKNSERSLCGRCSKEEDDRLEQRALMNAKQREREADPLYAIERAGRTETTKKMRQLLRQRSGKTWSVKGGRGTGWGWLTIAAPASRMDDYRMTAEDQAELANLLGERVHCQGVAVNSGEWFRYLKACRGDFTKAN